MADRAGGVRPNKAAPQDPTNERYMSSTGLEVLEKDNGFCESAARLLKRAGPTRRARVARTKGSDQNAALQQALAYRKIEYRPVIPAVALKQAKLCG
ncbi:hypothetical protein LOZ61_004670 [Ophidiomyces ophidiicola]|nr:hypothetical protein LOZ61_004670 [Ophidiomyces ophidiicola]KAI1924463.1 hypothetical protein LOZ60_004669 [Ophidiomyces ophidiicola]KAI2149574.1 hypothetical protein LOZ27_000723 [Ophidiomyces ophidiicola]KAI2377997.1 hypothetical protein LOY89_002039 [Ophidiomyces ophidiicola]KAI2399622.1 hypothetical protein LOY90_005155 [Ophidiomyces ophidiicola]